jgi:hypothetical protein
MCDCIDIKQATNVGSAVSYRVGETLHKHSAVSCSHTGRDVVDSVWAFEDL